MSLNHRFTLRIPARKSIQAGSFNVVRMFLGLAVSISEGFISGQDTGLVSRFGANVNYIT